MAFAVVSVCTRCIKPAFVSYKLNKLEINCLLFLLFLICASFTACTLDILHVLLDDPYNTLYTHFNKINVDMMIPLRLRNRNERAEGMWFLIRFGSERMFHIMPWVFSEDLRCWDLVAFIDFMGFSETNSNSLSNCSFVIHTSEISLFLKRFIQQQLY